MLKWRNLRDFIEMTIDDFEWSLFWYTFHYLSWYEMGALGCFALGWALSVYKMLKTGRADEKGLGFTWLSIIGGVLGVCYKLFFCLDVVVLLYMAIVVFALVNLALARKLCHIERVQARRAELIKRSGLYTSRGESLRHSASRRRHHHSRSVQSELEGESEQKSNEANLGVNEAACDDDKER